MLGHLEDDRSEKNQETEQGHDSALSEPACACIPDSSIDADMWVKAAEFVPGQQWQSVGK